MLDQGADEVVEARVVELAVQAVGAALSQGLLQQLPESWGGTASLQAICCGR
jgi:hypothetical protein